jgi:hypothetical protein
MHMKFPSIYQLWQATVNVVNRFTFPLIYTFIGTICAWLLVSSHKMDFQNQIYLTKGLYLGNLGLTLSLAFCLFSEKNNFSFYKKALVNVFIFLILCLFFFTLNPFDKESDILILVVLGFAFHLLVSISAFYSSGENNGFWQINKNFFLNFVIAVLYSACLFIGLAIALFSIEQLFGINWDGDIYIKLWIIIVGLFNTIFFLSGIASPIEKLNNEHAYPKGLKIFTQYVLIPLASIYLIILLAYEIKIIIEWQLPNGSVAVLVLGYAVFGMLSLLLVHPLRNDEDNKWIKAYSKIFYVLMLPLVPLLILAIYKRVDAYGITESRYILIILAGWLTFITLYFLVKGREQIRIIPISLVIISILICFGPWGISSVSKTSQQNRLAHLLEQESSPKRNNEIRNLVMYLNNNHGILALQPFVKADLHSVNEYFMNKQDSSYRNYNYKWESRDSVLSLLNISKEYEFENLGIDSEQVKYFKNEEEDILDVAGADKVIAFNSNMNQQNQKIRSFNIGNDRFVLSVDTSDILHLKINSGGALTFKMDTLLNDLIASKSLKGIEHEFNSYHAPLNKMIIQKELGQYKFISRFEQINSGYGENKKLKFLYYSGYVIVIKK